MKGSANGQIVRTSLVRSESISGLISSFIFSLVAPCTQVLIRRTEAIVSLKSVSYLGISGVERILAWTF